MGRTLQRGMAIAAIGSVAAIAQAPVATAQSAAPPAASAGLEEIVVTARRVQEKLQNVPVADTPFTTKELEERQIQDVADLGQGVPNLFVQYTQFSSANSPAFVIRGIGAVSDQISVDSPIGIYVDGVYIYGEVGLAFKMADLDQIEVLEGPQGTLLGRNTTGGAIMLTTKNPTGVLDGHLETSFGNYDFHRVKGWFDLPEFDGFSVRATVFHDDRGFLRTNPVGGAVFNLPPPIGTVTVAGGYSNLDENGGMLAVRYAGIDDLIVDFKADYSENFNGENATQNLGFSPSDQNLLQGLGIAGLIARGGLGPVGPYALPLLSPNKAQNSVPNWFDWNNGAEKVLGFNLTGQYDINDDLSVKSITGYRSQRVIESGQDIGGTAITTPALAGVLLGSAFPTDKFITGAPFCYSICGFASTTTVHTASEELQLIGHEERFDYIAGFFYFDQTGFIFSPAPFFAGSIPFNGLTSYPGGVLGNPFFTGNGVDGADNQSWAFYGHSTVHLNDVVDLSGGIRYSYDYRYYVKYDQNSPAALAGTGPYAPASAGSKSFDNVDWDLSLLWKVTPDINAYAKVSTGYLSGGIINTGPFDPVTITSYEAGIKSEWFDHRLRFNLIGWHTRQTDEQQNVVNATPAALVANGFPPNTPLGSAILSNPGLHTNRNGLEIQANAAPIEGLTLGFSFGVEANPSVNGVLQGQPDKNMGLNAEYDFPKFDNDMYFAIRADATWEAGYITGGLTVANVSTFPPSLLANLTRPDTWNLDLRGTLFDIPVGPFKGKISLWVKNLTDEQNVNFSYDIGTNTSGTFDLPRTWGGDLAIDF